MGVRAQCTLGIKNFGAGQPGYSGGKIAYRICVPYFRVEFEVFPPVDEPLRGRGVEELRGQVFQQRRHHIRHDRHERAGDLSLQGSQDRDSSGRFLARIW